MRSRLMDLLILWSTSSASQRLTELNDKSDQIGTLLLSVRIEIEFNVIANNHNQF